MEEVGIVLVTWLLYLVPFIPIAAPIWYFGRRRVQWNRWDFAMAVLPFATWLGLMMIAGAGKSITNLLELMVLGCAAPVAPVLRLVVGPRVNQRLLAIGLLITTCLLAVALWAFVPGLPE